MPLRVYAELVSPGVDGGMRALVRFGSGIEGELRCSLTAERFLTEIRVEGEKGRLLVKNPFLPQMGHKVEMIIGAERSERTFDTAPTYLFQAKAFSRAVRDGAPVLTTADDGVVNMRAIDALYRAAGMTPRLEGAA